jgi:DHA2 family multidrug resistance protein
MLSAVCLIALIIWERRAKQPILDLSIFGIPNYTPAVVLMFVLGTALYGSLVLVPLFLQNLLGYSATLSGLALSPGGIATLLCMPVVGYLVGRADVRYMVLFGLTMLTVSMFMAAGYNLNISFFDAVYPRLVMGVGLAFLFVPLATVMASFLPLPKMGAATGMFNLVRNIGGSFGIAAMTTLLARRAQFHQARLIPHVSLYDADFQQALRTGVADLVALGQPLWLAQKQVVGLAYASVLRQAMTMSYVDCFWLLGVAMIVIMPLVFIMRRAPRAEAGAPAMH